MAVWTIAAGLRGYRSARSASATILLRSVTPACVPPGSSNRSPPGDESFEPQGAYRGVGGRSPASSTSMGLSPVPRLVVVALEIHSAATDSVQVSRLPLVTNPLYPSGIRTTAQPGRTVMSSPGSSTSRASPRSSWLTISDACRGSRRNGAHETCTIADPIRGVSGIIGQMDSRRLQFALQEPLNVLRLQLFPIQADEAMGRIGAYEAKRRRTPPVKVQAHFGRGSWRE